MRINKDIAEQRAAATSTYPAPSPQEMACLLGIWDGLTVKETAARVGLQPKTVKNYLANLYLKFQAPGQVQLVRRALELGVLKIEQRNP